MVRTNRYEQPNTTNWNNDPKKKIASRDLFLHVRRQAHKKKGIAAAKPFKIISTLSRVHCFYNFHFR